MKPIICITKKEYQKANGVFDACPGFTCVPVSLEEAALSKTIKDHRAFAAIVGVDPYRDTLYTSLPRGGVIARFGVGHDGIDKPKATQHGLLATNTPGVLDDSVAEHAMLLMGGFIRHIAACHGGMKSRQWGPAIGSELCGKTLLVIGCGPIGRKTAKIAAFGFGMHVIGYDIGSVNAEQLQREFGIQSLCDNLDAALAEADVVSLHIPSVPATWHYVNSVFLSKLKPSCVLVNTARGPVVDEISLFDALNVKRIAGAALDVFENEPFKPVDPHKDLRTLDNVLLTPHIGSSTVEACRRMAESCLVNIKAAFERRYGDLNLLNPDVLKSLT